MEEDIIDRDPILDDELFSMLEEFNYDMYNLEPRRIEVYTLEDMIELSELFDVELKHTVVKKEGYTHHYMDINVEDDIVTIKYDEYE